MELLLVIVVAILLAMMIANSLKKGSRLNKRKCDHCRELVALSATICPHCRLDPRAPRAPRVTHWDRLKAKKS
jgi:hypothetical protein